ncbi:MAG: ion channel [Pseudomonadota bacterium]
MAKVSHHNSFIFLTLALIALLLLAAVGHSFAIGSSIHFSQGLVLITLIIVFFTLDFGHRWQRFVAIVFLVILVITTFSFFYANPWLTLAYRLVSLVFFLTTLIVSSPAVLFSGTRTRNAIMGTLALYLLLGIVWAHLYALMLFFIPDAFKGLDPQPGADPLPQLLYFSYVTLATLGYGDISPLAPIAKTLAYLQAITGTFYLAIIVASLIGSRLKR